MLPVLYSYRRCPYAIRARMALKVAGIEVDIREISLREKPVHMLKISPKSTVPVLSLQDDSVIEESLDIMRWALQQNDIAGWLDADMTLTSALISQNDGSFKQALDCYKYPERYPEKSQVEYREQGEIFLQKLEAMLLQNLYLLKGAPSLVDFAIFPFIRQFAAVDIGWFEGAPYPKLQAWLKSLVESALFKSVMEKQPVKQAL